MMPLQVPFNLGPFIVDIEGRLAPRVPETFPAFNIVWRRRAVHAHMIQGEPWDGRLKLRTILGRVPSTAGDERSRLRPLSFASLRAVRRDLPAAWEVRLLPDHKAVLEAELLIALPINAISLVTELTRFLLAMSPYLDLLDEGGLAEVAEPDGIANC